MVGNLKTNKYIILTFQRWDSGVGGYQFICSKSKQDAIDSLIELVGESFEDGDELYEDYEEWLDFKELINQIKDIGDCASDEAIIRLNFTCGNNEYYVACAGYAPEALIEALGIIKDNWYYCSEYDDEEDEEIDINIPIEEFKDKALRKRIDILIEMANNLDERFWSYFYSIENELFIF